MPRTLGRLCPALFLLLALLWPLTPVAASPDAAGSPLVGTPIRSVYVRVPQGATDSSMPLQVLLALHGIGGNGQDFSRELIEPADQYGWLLVAPTIDYGDWTNPSVVAHEDAQLIRALSDYLDQMPDVMNVQIG